MSIPKDKYAPYNGVVLYHWNSCGHCIQFRDTWNRLYDNFSNSMSMISIELEDMKRLPQDYQVNAFPTIYLYVNGKKIVYDNSRDYDTLKKTITSNIKSKSKTKK
jgi:thiol-disulfide isomerase/thioredoxin